jgi:hypothetical protein
MIRMTAALDHIPRRYWWPGVVICLLSFMSVLQAREAGFVIDAAVAPSGAAGFGDGSKLWLLGVPVGAWRAPGGALSTEEIYVTRPGLERGQLQSLQDRLSGLALVRLRLSAPPAKRRYPSGHERWEAVLVSIETSEVNDRELTAWVEKMRKPVVVRDDILGVLTFDRSLSSYEARRSLAGVPYDLAILIDTAPDAGRDSAAIKSLRATVAAIEAGVPRYREAAADELLENYNDNWRNDGDAVLSRREFASRLTLDSINVDSNGEIDVYFKDGEMFAGHVIQVRVDSAGRVRSIAIAG